MRVAKRSPSTKTIPASPKTQHRKPGFETADDSGGQVLPWSRTSHLSLDFAYMERDRGFLHRIVLNGNH